MSFSKVQISNDLDISFLESIHLFKNEEDWQINVFFYKATSNEIEQNWVKVRNALAAIYQSDLIENEIETEFERWNMYIIYVSHESISKTLKNSIEADKFSSRKIVEDCFKGEFSETRANELIVKHITNTDLNELVEKELEKKKLHKSVKHIPLNIAIWNSIPNEDLKRDLNSQKSILMEIAKKIDNEN